MDAYVEGAPELAVEVLSPSDRRGDMDRKIAQYLASGARAVWLVDPEKREVYVHEPGREVRSLTAGDVITGPEPLRGFTARVSKFFE